MKTLLISVFAFVLSISLFAGPGTGGGIGTNPNVIEKRLNQNIKKQFIRHNLDGIYAISSSSGDYARIEDLKENYISFEGIIIIENYLVIDKKIATKYSIYKEIYRND